MKDFPIIDADGHVTETIGSLRRHLRWEHRERPLMNSEAWDRTFGGALGKRNEDPKVQLADMDLDGIDAAFLYPSLGLFAGAVRDPAFAAAMCRAYNR